MIDPNNVSDIILNGAVCADCGEELSPQETVYPLTRQGFLTYIQKTMPTNGACLGEPAICIQCKIYREP